MHSEKTSFGLLSRSDEEKLNTKLKTIATKKNNKTFNKSRQEELFYKYLCTRYDESNIIRQYSDDRYPFLCDFYIKNKDLFIELNLNWTHAHHPFNCDDLDDVALLEAWKEKAKTSKYYKNAIQTWTVRDVKKLQTAKENNLNYITIYWDEWKQLEKEIERDELTWSKEIC